MSVSRLICTDREEVDGEGLRVLPTKHWLRLDLGVPQLHGTVLVYLDPKVILSVHFSKRPLLHLKWFQKRLECNKFTINNKVQMINCLTFEGHFLRKSRFVIKKGSKHNNFKMMLFLDFTCFFLFFYITALLIQVLKCSFECLLQPAPLAILIRSLLPLCHYRSACRQGVALCESHSVGL